MIQRIQTIFWILSIIFIALFLAQKFDMELGTKIFQESHFSIVSVIAILLNCFAIFTFRKRRRQINFSTLSLILLIIQFILLFYAHQKQILDHYKMAYVYLILGTISNALGGYFTKQDIKLLDQSSRLR
jgi:cytochrome bd-type quinol oxidase subunit 2